MSERAGSLLTARDQLQLSAGHLGTPPGAFARLPGLGSGTSMFFLTGVCLPRLFSV